MGAVFQQSGAMPVFPVMARPGLSQEPPIPTTWDSHLPGHDEFGRSQPAYGDEKMPVIDPNDLRSPNIPSPAKR